jgi:hypothetical protein
VHARALTLLASLAALGCKPAEPMSAGTSTESGESTLAETSESDTTETTGAPDDLPPSCPDPQPCPDCTCLAGAWSCTCEPAEPEAGFVTIAAYDYTLETSAGQPAMLSTTGHRQFYAFAPAGEAAWDAPLFVLFNGGPVVSSGMLLGLNIGPMTFAPGATAGAELAENPHSWTQLGNLLWIDARHAGFSYDLLDDPADPLARADALSFANFNAYVDAGQFVRVLLAFLATHEQLRDNPIVLVGESYAGTRAQLMLDMLLHPSAWADGSRRMTDLALVDVIAAHHTAVLGVPTPSPEQIAAQFGRQILLQPALTGNLQKLAAGALFEQPGSVVEQLALDWGLDFIPCAEQQGACSPYTNAQAFVQAAGHSSYDTAAPLTWLDDTFALVNARCNDATVLEQLLGVPLAELPDLAPAARTQAWRLLGEDDYISDGQAGDLEQTLGPLAPWDRYFLPFEYGAFNQFTGFVASQYGVHPDDPHYGEYLLRNLLWVDTLISSTERDLVIYTPAIPDALREYAAIVADVEVGTGEWTISYQPDGFGEWPDPGVRTVTVPQYDAGHAISIDAAAKLLTDVQVWLQATR